MASSIKPLDLTHGAHFLLLPAVVVLEMTAYYGARSALIPFLTGELGLETAEAYEIYRSATLLMWVLPLVGGVASMIFGPYAVLLAGALLCTVGSGLLAGSEPSTVGVALGVLTVGQGLLRPALWTIAAMQLSDRHHARVAWFTGLYVLVTLGAYLGSTAAAAVGITGDIRAAFGGFGLGHALAATLVVPLWIAGRRQTWLEPSLDETLPWVGVTLGTIVLVTPFWAAMTVSMTASYTAMSASATGPLLMLSPLVIGVGGVFVMGLWIVLQLLEVRVPALVLVGVALIAAGVGMVLSLPDVYNVLGMGAVTAGLIGLALCEVVAIPAAMAQLGAGTHWRLVPLWFGLFASASSLAGWVGDTVSTSLGVEAAVGGSAFAVAMAGVVMLLGAVALRDLLSPGSPDLADQASSST